MKYLAWILSLSLIMLSCDKTDIISEDHSLVNTKHLDHLFEEIMLNGETAATIHIYAEYPDYNWTDASGEGIGCIDDVARAALFYFREAAKTNDPEHEKKAGLLLKFITSLQAENGYFYNFIDTNYQIEKETKNSTPKGDWWAWRALWAMCEAENYYSRKDPQKAFDLQIMIAKVIENILIEIDPYPQTEEIDGFPFPTWLPVRNAADQASVIILALAPYGKRHADERINKIIRYLSDGIILMQIKDELSPVYGAFLSWKNRWHAYGNSQADALLYASELLDEVKYSEAALLEIDHFYSFLFEENYLNSLVIQRSEEGTVIAEKKQFEQISYGLRPMVFSCLHAYDLTGKKEYLLKATRIAGWLSGKNIIGNKIYDSENGRCFDGIDSENKINMNSGAESTIEALLILQIMEKYEEANRTLLDQFNKRDDN